MRARLLSELSYSRREIKTLQLCPLTRMRWSDDRRECLNTHAGRFIGKAHHGPSLRCQANRGWAFAFLAPRHR